MPGPPKKPTAISKLGPRQHTKKNKREPKPKQKELSCPSWLDGEGKSAFTDLGKILDEIKVITEADKTALTLLSDAYSEYRCARDVILKEGMTYKTTTQTGDTMIRTRPEVNIAQDAWNRCWRMLKEFGLTPSARTRVQTVGDEQESDPFEDLLNQANTIRRVK